MSRWPQITPEIKELNLKRFNHIIKTKPQSYWLDKCLTGNVPCAPVSTYEDLQKGMQTEVGKQARVNDWIVTSNHRDYGDVDLVSNPTRYNGTPNQPIGDGDEVTRHAPKLGEHSIDILKNVLKYDENDIQRIQNSGAIEPTGAWSTEKIPLKRIERVKKMVQDRRNSALHDGDGHQGGNGRSKL